MTTPSNQADSVEALAAEFLERWRQGESPTIDDYAVQHPELADTIRDLFPMIAALEGMKRDGNKQAAQRATRQPLQLKQLGDFKILREIGRGGMGIVYEAQQESLGRRVALKVLPKQALLDPAQLKRFHREARIAARLHHTNIVSIYGTGQHDGYHFLVMELVDGDSLDKLIARLRSAADTASPAIGPPAFQYRDVARIGHDAARALQHAHERDVLHRDIKPGNLILDTVGNIWLSDLGLAQAMEPQGAEDGNRTQTVGGTLSYMPPEVFAGQVDARSDVYSLGLTLYELLILQPAFDESNAAQAIRQITQASTPPRRPREIDSRIPKDLETIILKACEPDPTRRYATAGELADDLRRFLEQRPVHARRASTVEHAWRWCGRNRLVASLSAATLAMLLLLSGVMTWSFLRAESANREVKMALEREMVQRERSEQTLRVATASLNDIYRDFAPGDLPSSSTDTPEEGGNDRATATLSPETAIVLENLLTFYDRLAENSGDDIRLQESSARALGRMGDIYRQIGQRQKGLDNYHQALTSLRAIAGDADDRIDHMALTVEISRVLNEIGRVLRADGDQKQALESHHDVLKTLRNLPPGPGSSSARQQAQYEQARAHYYLARQRPASASRVALDQLRMDDRRRGGGPRRPNGGRRLPPPPASPLLDSSIGRWLTGNGPPPGSDRLRREHVTTAIDLLNELIESAEPDPRYQFLQACCYREIPRDPPNTSRGNRPSVEEAAMLELAPDLSASQQRAIELLKGLVEQHPNNAAFLHELIETLRQPERHDGRRLPATVRRENSQLEAVRLREALPLAKELVARHPNIPAYAISKMHVLHQLGHLYQAIAAIPPGESDTSEDPDEILSKAIEALRSARKQIQTVCRRWPDQPEYLLWSIVVDGSLAKCLHQVGDNQSAETTVRSAQESLDQLVARQDTDGWLRRQLPQVRRVVAVLAKTVQRENRP